MSVNASGNVRAGYVVIYIFTGTPYWFQQFYFALPYYFIFKKLET